MRPAMFGNLAILTVDQHRSDELTAYAYKSIESSKVGPQ